MTTTPTLDLDALTRLCDEASEGPWYRVEGFWLGSGDITYVIRGNPDPHVGVAVCDFEVQRDQSDDEDEADVNDWNDAAFIATARTALPALIAKCRELQEENERLRTLVEYIKLQAQSHACEANTANSTIHEIYQVCTGATGEPGTWHGAEPVRRLSDQLAAAQERIKALEGGMKDLIDREDAPDRCSISMSHRRTYDAARSLIGYPKEQKGKPSHD